MLVFGTAILQVKQLAAQALGDLVAGVGHVDGVVLADQLAHWRDDRGSATGEYLTDLAGGDTVAPLIDGDGALFHTEPFVTRQCQDRIAGYPFQNGIGQARGDQAAILVDEEQVHAAQFFDPLVFGGIQEGDLAAAVLVGFFLRRKRGSVVAAALGKAGAARGGALVVRGEPDRYGGDTALEVGTGGGGDNVVVDLLSRAYAEELLAGDHERTQIEARLVSLVGGCWHPVMVKLDQRAQRSEEHTSELQSRGHLVCRLLLEKKKNEH